MKSLQQLARGDLDEGFNYNASNEISFCEPCLKVKHHKSQFPLYSEKRQSKPLELIHSDVCGKLSSKSLGGAEYFVTFIDDKTRYVWAYAIKKKSDVFKRFCEWKIEVEKSLGQSVKILRTDNGGEFTSSEFESYLTSHFSGNCNQSLIDVLDYTFTLTESKADPFVYSL